MQAANHELEKLCGAQLSDLGTQRETIDPAMLDAHLAKWPGDGDEGGDIKPGDNGGDPRRIGYLSATIVSTGISSLWQPSVHRDIAF